MKNICLHCVSTDVHLWFCMSIWLHLCFLSRHLSNMHHIWGWGAIVCDLFPLSVLGCVWYFCFESHLVPFKKNVGALWHCLYHKRARNTWRRFEFDLQLFPPWPEDQIKHTREVAHPFLSVPWETMHSDLILFVGQAVSFNNVLIFCQMMLVNWSWLCQMLQE